MGVPRAPVFFCIRSHSINTRIKFLCIIYSQATLTFTNKKKEKNIRQFKTPRKVSDPATGRKIKKSEADKVARFKTMAHPSRKWMGKAAAVVLLPFRETAPLNRVTKQKERA